jgi:hypothetical protein
MDLQLKSQHQKILADILWQAEDMNQVEAVLNLYGTEAMIVYHMMVAAHLDEQVDDFADAFNLLSRFMLA